MGGEQVDKLIFSLDADLAPLKARYAQVEAETAATAAKVEKTWAGTSQRIETMVGSNRQFKDASASASVFSAALGDTGKQAELARQKFLALNGVTTGMHGSINQATREFRALFDELSSGRTRMTPGTLAIIATRVFGISGAALVAGAALAAMPIGFIAAAVMAESHLEGIERRLKATGYAAGVSRDQLLSMASALNMTTGLSQRGAGDVLTTLAGRGNIPSNLLPGAAKAAEGLSAATGEKLDKAAAEFERMLADPAKGAKELDDAFKLLSPATLRQIEDLDASGQKEQAQALLIDQVNARFGVLRDKANVLGNFFDGLGKKLSNLWSGFGMAANLTLGGGTAQQQLQQLRFGMSMPGYAYNHLPSEKAADEARVKALQAEIDAENRASKAGETRVKTNVAIGDGLAVVDKNTGAFAQHLRDLQNTLNKLSYDAILAKNAHSQYAAAIETQRAATERALKAEKARTPEALAAERAADALAVANKPSTQQAQFAAELAARRTHEANLANPAMTASQADAIYASDLKAAQAAGIKANDRTGERRERTLDAMKAEADAELTVARAYDQGTAGVERARAVGQAHVALIKGEINDEKAYAAALMQRAFATKAAEVAQKVANDNNQNQGLRRLVATGGNPAAIAAVTARNEALVATQQERDNAVTQDEIDLATRHLDLLTKENVERALLNATMQANVEVFTKTNEITMMMQRAQALANGANSDDMRRIIAAQDVYTQLVHSGIDPTTQAFRDLFNQLAPLAIKLSDVSDAFNKAQKEAESLANGVTGPLGQFLTHGGSPLQAAGSIAQNELDTLVQSQIIEPMNKYFQGLFGSWLGNTVGKPDGSSPASALWVQMLGGGGGTGVGLKDLAGLVSGNSAGPSGGGLSGLFSVLGGSTGGAASGLAGDVGEAAKGGGFLSDIFSWFAGLFDDGGTIGPGQWGIKSGMPEIIQGGTTGVSVMPLAAPVVTAAVSRIAQTAANTNGPNGRTIGGGGSVTNNHWHFYGNPNQRDVLTAKSQWEASASRLAGRGQRST